MTFPPGGPRARAAAAVAALVLVLAGCGESDPLGAPAATPGPTASTPGSAEPAGSSPPVGTSTTAVAPALAEYHVQDLEWTSCGGGFQCTKVTVPVDYAAPEGKTLELAMTRLGAAGPGRRIGSLLVNPGGPGASGVKYLQAAYTSITEPVRARYDLVSFDPRGIGKSKPINCLTDRQLDELLAADVTMDDESDVRTWDRLARRFAESCAENTGNALLRHVGTDDVARDLDVLRAVLGDKQLHYLGFSYGTYIGARYAELFPTRVGRLVLDGALDPSLSAEDLNLAQAKGFQTAWKAFVEACLDLSDCPIGGKEGEVDTRLVGMFKAADRSPLRSRSGREVTEALAATGVLSALYSTQRWEFLRSALAAAYNGDGTGLLFLADAYFQREDDGSFPDNSNEAIYAVNCLDRPVEESVADIQGRLPTYREASPLFGEFIAWSLLPCTYWPVPTDTVPGPVRAAGAAPIMVIGTTRDPATPYAWAIALAEQLKSGVFVSHDGDGHTVYGDGDPCIDPIVNDYLVNGETPRDGVECK